MKHLKTYKIFESEEKYYCSRDKRLLEFDEVKDIFLYRDFEEFIDSRTDIEIFDRKIDLRETPEKGIYIVFEDNGHANPELDSVRITIMFFSPRDFADPSGNDSELISDIKKYMINFEKSLDDIKLDLIPLFEGLQRNPNDFNLLYKISMRVEPQLTFI